MNCDDPLAMDTIWPDEILCQWETEMADRIALVDDDQNILTNHIL